jgi:hypothetical protein
MEIKQVETDAFSAPTGMETAQLQARLLHRPPRLGQGATTATEARSQIVSRGQGPPTGQQIPNSADRQGQLLSDWQGGQTRLVEVKDVLTQFRRGSSWHGSGLL